jgi:hypothetical protein
LLSFLNKKTANIKILGNTPSVGEGSEGCRRQTAGPQR